MRNQLTGRETRCKQMSTQLSRGQQDAGLCIAVFNPPRVDILSVCESGPRRGIEMALELLRPLTLQRALREHAEPKPSGLSSPEELLFLHPKLGKKMVGGAVIMPHFSYQKFDLRPLKLWFKDLQLKFLLLHLQMWCSSE